jgi:hypothetical protein
MGFYLGFVSCSIITFAELALRDLSTILPIENDKNIQGLA